MPVGYLWTRLLGYFTFIALQVVFFVNGGFWIGGFCLHSAHDPSCASASAAMVTPAETTWKEKGLIPASSPPSGGVKAGT